MATKYFIPETAHTEQSEPFSSKGKAVEAAELAAQEYPDTAFRVSTAKGTIVHTAQAESVDVTDAPSVDDVPEVQVDADTEDGPSFADMLRESLTLPTGDEAEDNPADSAPDENTPDNPDAAGEDDDSEDSGADSEDGGEELDEEDQAAMAKLAAKALRTSRATPRPVAPTPPAPEGAALELCANNTWAKRMHYRIAGETRSLCRSVKTSRRANAHQVETAPLCTACEKLGKGQAVDTRPAGTSRGGSGSRKEPMTVVIDAGDIREMVACLKKGEPFEMETTGGKRILVVAGDPVTGARDEEGSAVSDVQSIAIVST